MFRVDDDEFVTRGSVGFSVAVSRAGPRRVGLQLHVAVIFGEVPEVALLMQPAIFLLSARKVTLPAVETLTVIWIGVRYVANSVDPAKLIELTVEGVIIERPALLMAPETKDS
jgi:hypothetical protein